MSDSYSLKWLAAYLECKWQGDENVHVSALADLGEAQAYHLSFLSKKQYVPFLDTTAAGIVLVHPDQPVPDRLNVIWTTNPYLAYAKLSGLFDRRQKQPGIHPSAIVHSTATIGQDVMIGAKCVVEEHAHIGSGTELLPGVVIGACASVGCECVIFPNVVIYHGVTIGDRVRIHGGTVIGSDGFGFAPTKQGWQKIHQLGAVTIGSDVEIGACTAVDRGAINDTVIGDGVIIDNQVHIAHNVKIGANTAIAGCVGIAGSTTVGANCTIGGFVAINGHLTICDNVHFNGGTVVMKSVHQAGVYSSGTGMQEARLWRKNAVRFGQLDSWVEKVKKLEKDCADKKADSETDDKNE